MSLRSSKHACALLEPSESESERECPLVFSSRSKNRMTNSLGAFSNLDSSTRIPPEVPKRFTLLNHEHESRRGSKGSLACRIVTNAEIANEKGERVRLGLLEQSSLRGPLFAQSSSIFNLTSLEYDRSQELSTSSVSSTDTPSKGLVLSSTDPNGIPVRH